MTTPASATLLATARCHLGEAPADAVRTAAAACETDTLIAAAEWHGMAPLLAEALHRASADAALLAPVCARAADHARRSLQLAAALARTIDLLRGAGIHVIAFKGPVLALSGYGELALRPTSDLDLLVAPAELWHARAVLEQAGFSSDVALPRAAEAAYLRAESAWNLRSHRGDVALDLHWRFTARLFRLPLDSAGMFNRANAVNIAGVNVPALCAVDQLLVLATHNWKHQFCKLIWLLDFAVAARHCRDWDAVAALARQARCQRILALNAEVVHRLFVTAVPAALARDAGIASLATEAESYLWRAEFPRLSARDRAFALRARDGWFDAAAALVTSAFTPAAGDFRYGRFPHLAKLARAARASLPGLPARSRHTNA